MTRINLLPPEARVKASRERGLMYAILLLVVVVVVLGLVYVWQNGMVSSKQTQLDGITAQQSSADLQKAALLPYGQIQTERAQMTQTATGLYNARIPWSTILQEISLVIPANVRLQSLTCNVPANLQAGAAGTAASGTAATTSTTDVSFAGTTYTNDDVATFMTRLGLIPQLENVLLTSSATSTSTSSSGTSGTTASTTTVTFTVTASLRPYLTAPPSTTLSQVSP